jgi:hypothetical protein
VQIESLRFLRIENCSLQKLPGTIAKRGSTLQASNSAPSLNSTLSRDWVAFLQRECCVRPAMTR